MIHNIIHISDIHIRSGDSTKSRYNEYISTFDNLYESISKQSIIDSVIVITGDIFHDKNMIGPSGLKIAIYLLQKLSSLTTVFVIRGNHDYRQDHPNEPDMISGLMSYDIPNVVYLDKTGIHTYKNISFGLVAIQDTLLYGSTSGISSNLPDFPIPIDSNYKIALFHGTIKGCTLQNGIKSTIDGYPIDWIKGYDAILLGDIHLQQITRAKLIENTDISLPFTSLSHSYTYQDTPWGYPGSLIQQNFGEPIKGHGYILWDLQHKHITCYHVKNNYGMIKLYYNGNPDDIHIEHKQYIKPITKTAPLHKIIATKWFPDNLHVRVIGASADDLPIITEKIQSYHKCVLSISRTKQTVTTIDNSDPIHSINSIDNLINYINDSLIKDNKTISKLNQWLLHPETLIIPNIPDKMLSKLLNRIATVEKSSLKYMEAFDTIIQPSSGLTLHRLEWNWVLNYKNGNLFDFDKNIKNISVLNAKNGNGKSNFLEIICIALFGEGFPSRHNVKYSAGIICDKKPTGVMASTCITFTLKSVTYMLKRVMRNAATKRNLDFEDVILYKDKEILHQKNNAVSQWIDLNIGKCDTYLMSAMMSQNADCDFFALDKKPQKELLDRVLSLEHINSLKILLDDSIKYYKATIDIIESYCDGASTRVLDQKSIEDLLFYKSKLQSIHKNDKWNIVSENELREYSPSRITDLENIIASLPTDNKKDVKNTIRSLDESIAYVIGELSRYYSFSDLVCIHNVSECDLSQLESTLKQHPYYTSHSLYDDIYIDEQYRNDLDNLELFNIINEFTTWNKIQDQIYSNDKKYLENTFEIDQLKNKIDQLLQHIHEYPDKITTITKQLATLKKSFSKIKKDKESCSDKRPNKPSAAKEYLSGISICDLHTLHTEKQFIIQSIRHIPIICSHISNTTQKILECESYINECSSLPFNSECDACKKQSWRTKYDSVITELPLLLSKNETYYNELHTFGLDGLGLDRLDRLDYQTHIVDLEIRLEAIHKSILDITFYHSETELWDKWDKWTHIYEILKHKYETLDSDITRLENEKKELEKILSRSKLEKQTLQLKLESIQAKKHDYDTYILELQSRQLYISDITHKLEYNWYTMLHAYRASIHKHITICNETLLADRKRKDELDNCLVMIRQRDTYKKELDRLLVIKEMHPYWIKWKEDCEIENELILKIREIESYTHNDTDLMSLLQTIKSDCSDLSYISDSFKGYREWIYCEYVGPMIQKKVNTILESICDDRPLYLEYTWLHTIDTLSWFIRDGSSRPIIEKASGFQRFIIGIAMRVVINQLGLSKVHYTELFIDEGFTSCDSDNLEKIPDFLRGLLRFYNNIYLATHLDCLKGCADKQIIIQRDAGLSLIQYGDIQSIVTETCKKGRPLKNSVIVTKV